MTSVMMGQQSYRLQKGVALVQVLITTAIIMLLMIFFLGAAKSQVERAKALQDKTAAYMAYYSAKNQVLYELLTTDISLLPAKGWNYHGVPFKLDEHTNVSLQDLNGLLSLSSMTQENILQGILGQALPSAQATTIAQSIMDWVDADNISLAYGAEQDSYSSIGIRMRNGPIQTYSEFAFIKGMTYEAEQVLMENTTVHPTPFFNPMTAPEKVLAAYTDTSRAAAVINARSQQDYGRRAVEELTQVFDDDGINYLVGPGFRLTINSKVADSFFGKVLEYGIFPYRDRPIEVLSRLPRQQLTR